MASSSSSAHANGHGLSQISLALEATYDPRSTNETRQSALQFLEEAKKQLDAPQHGFALASDTNQQPAIRHFGLSLLEFALRYRWEDYSQEQADTLRGWVLTLARDVADSDPLYFRNKVALLWIEVAKRCWAAEWMDMDEMLVALWDTSDAGKQLVYRQMVLYILECLSEDICNREDTIAGLRQDVLGQAFNEIIIPQRLYQEHLSARDNSQNVRYTQDGWLSRLSAFVSSCCAAISQADAQASNLAIKTLEALKPTTLWVSLQGLAESNTLDALYAVISTGNVAVQTVFLGAHVVNGKMLRWNRRQSKSYSPSSNVHTIHTFMTLGLYACDRPCSVIESNSCEPYTCPAKPTPMTLTSPNTRSRRS